ncbi:hypothetical protein ACI7YT_11215 [Microbacterium sp. M]|uniref:hypothetical protein n=1 Tax=Microbacterium sp. M TaxID=3377125 RepID=UPI0038686F2F
MHRLSQVAVLISVLSASLTFEMAGFSAGCSAAERATVGCTEPGSDGTQVVIDGSRTKDGKDGRDGDNGNEGSRDRDDVGDAGPAQPAPPSEFEKCLDDWNRYIGCFQRVDPADPADPAEPVPAIPAVTITDLARFAPEGVLVAAEPDNVGVVGLPTNFVASASTQTVAGELFGYPISVRFTPVGFDFDYGDGSITTTSTGGQSWAALNQAQFTPTETSHVYAVRGDYTTAVDVRYTAEIDLGIGWFPIDGELTSAGRAQQVRIFEAHTALVAHTCEQAPSSPGC